MLQPLHSHFPAFAGGLILLPGAIAGLVLLLQRHGFSGQVLLFWWSALAALVAALALAHLPGGSSVTALLVEGLHALFTILLLMGLVASTGQDPATTFKPLAAVIAMSLAAGLALGSVDGVEGTRLALALFAALVLALTAGRAHTALRLVDNPFKAGEAPMVPLLLAVLALVGALDFISRLGAMAAVHEPLLSVKLMLGAVVLVGLSVTEHRAAAGDAALLRRRAEEAGRRLQETEQRLRDLSELSEEWAW